MSLRRAAIAALLLATATAVAAPAAAQAGLSLNPRIGLFAPLTDLGDQAIGTGFERAIRLDHSLAFGLGLQLGLPRLPFDLRANLDYATGATVTRHGVDNETGQTTVLAVAGDLVFRPLPRLILLQPYFFAGGGLRQYAFDFDDAAAFRDASDPALHLGGGLDFGVGSLRLNAEIGDYVSRYRLQEGAASRLQHDLFLSVGFIVRML
jgi:hypothetical protein